MGSTKTVPDQPVQRDLRVMGSQAHIVVHGGDVAMLDAAERRLHQLESLWSRFRDDSDITRANQAGGYPVVVHEDTLAVVSRAIQAWKQTDGLFDITTLPALLDHGYTHSAVSRQAAPPVGGTQVGQCGWIEVDYATSMLRVPSTTAIDLGGIGKGFAADIVAESIIEAGAEGALVNVGGDLVVLGTPSDDTSWQVGIEDACRPPEHVTVLRLLSGGVATSGTTIRRWTSPSGEAAHHLIDPRHQHPSGSGLLTATVIAVDAATAEAFATAAMMLTAPEAVDLLDSVGLAGLVITSSGAVLCSESLTEFAPIDPAWARFRYQ